MKKIIAIIMIAVLALLSTVAALPAAAETEETVLTVACSADWMATGDDRGAYVDEDGLTDVNAAFSAAYQAETGQVVTVRLATCENDRALWRALIDGTCDTVLLPDYLIARARRENRLAPLTDVEAGAAALGNDWQYDPEGAYSVPYMSGYMGIVYNADLVNGTVNSWSALWDEALKGKILMTDNGRDAFAIALSKNGFDPNTNNSAQWQKAKEDLTAQQEVAQPATAAQIAAKMGAGEACLAPCSYGAYLRMKAHADDGVNLAFGTVTANLARRFTYAFCLPKKGQTPAVAQAYIRYLCGYEAGVANANYTGEASPLPDVRANTGDGYYHFVGDPGVYPSQTVLSNTVETVDPGATLQGYIDEYEGGESDRGGNIWLYAGIGTAAIVAVVLLLLMRLRRRKRTATAKQA